MEGGSCRRRRSSLSELNFVEDTRFQRKKVPAFSYDSSGTLERGTQWYFPVVRYKRIVGHPLFITSNRWLELGGYSGSTVCLERS
jgi:hypothetical protein